MKVFRASALVCFAGLVASGSVFAQTCGAPAPTALTSTTTGTIDLCAAAGSFVTKYCILNNNPSKDYAFSFTLGAGYTATSFTLTNVSGGWTPLVTIQKTCGSPTDCTSSTTGTSTAGSTAAVTLTDSDNSNLPLAAGSYFLLVSGSGGTANCGTFNISSNGSLPVSLSSFSVD